MDTSERNAGAAGVERKAPMVLAAVGCERRPMGDPRVRELPGPSGKSPRAASRRSLMAALAVPALLAGCRTEPPPAPDPTPVSLEGPLPEVLDRLCAAWTDARDPKSRDQIERQHASVALDLVARELTVAFARGGRSPTVSIVDFTTFGDAPSEEGHEWASRLATRLVRDGGVRVTKRAAPQDIIAHLKTTQSDLYDPEHVPEIGRFLASDYFIYGRLLEAVTVQAVSTETCEVVAAAEACRPCFRRGGVGPLAIWDQLQSIQGAGDAFGLTVRTDRQSYRIGEPVTVHVGLRKAGHVAIISLQADGRLVQLFPNGFSGSGLVSPGRELSVPPPDAEWEIEALPPAGTQRIKAIASSRPVFLVDGTQRPPGTSPFRSIDDPAGGLQTSRDLGIRLKGSGTQEWQEASWTFEILP